MKEPLLPQKASLMPPVSQLLSLTPQESRHPEVSPPHRTRLLSSAEEVPMVRTSDNSQAPKGGRDPAWHEQLVRGRVEGTARPSQLGRSYLYPAPGPALPEDPAPLP